MITGANRGIGLGLTRHYLQNGKHVVATYRTESAELEALQKEFPSHFTAVQMNILDKDSVKNAFDTIVSKVDAIDVLINNAGRYGSGQRTIDEEFDVEDMILTYRTNTLGPLLVTQSALPLLEKGSDKKAIHISSKVGSIADNGMGGSYGYRASKTALNMVNKNLSLELKDKDVASIVMHPGWVQTDMGGPNATVTIDDSVQALAETIERFTMEHTGGFFERTGEPIPW